MEERSKKVDEDCPYCGPNSVFNTMEDKEIYELAIEEEELYFEQQEWCKNCGMEERTPRRAPLLGYLHSLKVLLDEFIVGGKDSKIFKCSRCGEPLNVIIGQELYQFIVLSAKLYTKSPKKGNI